MFKDKFPGNNNNDLEWTKDIGLVWTKSVLVANLQPNDRRSAGTSLTLEGLKKNNNQQIQHWITHCSSCQHKQSPTERNRSRSWAVTRLIFPRGSWSTSSLPPLRKKIAAARTGRVLKPATSTQTTLEFYLIMFQLQIYSEHRENWHTFIWYFIYINIYITASTRPWITAGMESEKTSVSQHPPH